MTVASNKQAAALSETLRLAAAKKALESARANLSAGERMLLQLSERRSADNTNASSRALVERLSGHAGVGQSSRVAVLTVVARTSRVGG
jgi:hypothetical protein